MIHYIYNYFLTRQPTKKSDKWVHWQIYKYLRAQLIRYYKNKSKNSLGIDDQSNLIVSNITPANPGDSINIYSNISVIGGLTATDGVIVSEISSVTKDPNIFINFEHF